MQFLYPYFLWALVALAIPVIIHLFYFRRFKKVQFTNVRFLKEIKEETSHRSRIRNLLVLLARLLALTCLVLAFAYPFLKDNEDTVIGRKASSIFVDNSFSMQSKDSDVTLLERAKEAARAIVESHDDADLFQVITHDLEARHQRWMDKEDALGMIDEINVSSSSHGITDIYKRQKQLFQRAPEYHHQVYWISDFQKGMMDTEPVDSSIALYLIPLQSVEENNVSIDSVWLSAPIATGNDKNPIYIQLSNHGNGNVDNIRLSVTYNQQTRPLKIFNLEAGATLTDTFSLSVKGEGWQSAQFKITDYPVTFDDDYFMAFEVPGSMQALVISDSQANGDLSHALSSFDNVKTTLQNSRNVTYSDLPTYDLIILDEPGEISTGLATELVKAQLSGNNILFFPNPNGNLDSYNNYFSKVQGPSLQNKSSSEREVSRINTDEFVFNDVFFKISKNIRLPETQLSFPIKSRGRGQIENLLTYRDGGAFLSKITFGEGRLYICASPLDQNANNLTKNAEIFVPMIYKMMLSRSTKNERSLIIGQDEIVQIPNPGLKSDDILEITGAQTFIPGIQKLGEKLLLTTEGQVRESGIYQLQRKNDILRLLAFNYSRLESPMEYIELTNQYIGQLSPTARVFSAQNNTQLATFISEEKEGISYWRILLVLSLIFLGLEQLLLRFWKV